MDALRAELKTSDVVFRVMEPSEDGHEHRGPEFYDILKERGLVRWKRRPSWSKTLQRKMKPDDREEFFDGLHKTPGV